MIGIIISNFLILGMFTILGSSNFSFRFKENKKSILIFVLFYVFINFINCNGVSTLKGFLLLIANFAYFFLQFKGKFLRKLLVLIPLPIIIIFSEILISNLLNIIPHMGYTTDINSLRYIVGTLLSNVVSILVLILYTKLVKLFKENQLPKYSWILLILPISTYIFIINLKEILFPQINIGLLLSIIGMVVANFLLYYLFYKTIVDFNKMEEAKQREKKLVMKMDLLDKQYDSNFKFLHDLLNQCNKLNIDIENKDLVNAKKEIVELYDVTFNEFNAIQSNLMVVNTILKERMLQLNEERIKIDTELVYNDFGFMKLSDQYTLFNALLDGAIQACVDSKRSDKYIHLSSKQKGNQIIIFFVFSSDESFSIKTELDDLLNSYHGTISIKQDLNESKMRVILLFQKTDTLA